MPNTSNSMVNQVIFLISPKTHFLDLAGPDQVFFEAIDFGAPLKLEYCRYADTAYSSSGIYFEKLKHFSKIKLNKGDYVFIPGVDIKLLLSKETTGRKDLFNWLRKAYENGVILCSVCTGAFLLAASGLLDGRNATTHWKRVKELKEHYPKINVLENVLFTTDDRIYTSAGIVAGIDLALFVLEKMMGEFFAHKVARELVMYMRRSANEPQQSSFVNYRNHIHTGIHRVQDWLAENLDKRVTLSDLAFKANMSDRNFTRVFKRETSLTVNQYLNKLRKDKITYLLKQPDMSRAQIAKQCGLKSERQLSRIINSP